MSSRITYKDIKSNWPFDLKIIEITDGISMQLKQLNIIK